MSRLRFFIHSLAHLTTDGYGGFLAPLLPLLAARHDLSLAAAGLLVTSQTLTASLFQPIWGWISDRRPSRWFIVCGVFAAGLFFSLMSLAGNVYALVLIIVAGGMGISCFHPMATALATNMVSKRKGLAIAFFVTAGTAGYALGPVFISCLIECVGLNLMPLAVVPAVVVAGLWLLLGPTDVSGIGKKNAAKSSEQIPVATSHWPVVLLSATSIIRAFVLLTFTNFLPFYLLSLGMDLSSRSFYLFALQIGSSMGSLIGGSLSDRWGRWRMMFWSPLVALPLFYLFLFTGGLLSLALLFLAGILVFASTPAVLIASQKIMLRRQSMASALQIGFAWGTAGLLMGPAGKVGEMIGIDRMLLMVALLPLLMSLLALPLKKYQRQFEPSWIQKNSKTIGSPFDSRRN